MARLMKMMRILSRELILLLFRSKIRRVGTAHQCSRIETGFSVGIAHPARLIGFSVGIAHPTRLIGFSVGIAHPTRLIEFVGWALPTNVLKGEKESLNEVYI